MTSSRRLILVDTLRGVAIVLMVIFHFCFDLGHLGLADFDFYNDRFWLHARTFILSSFLFLVGVGLVLATASGFRWKRYFRRLGLLFAGAMLVSLSTWWMFAERYVFFGVLHFIALASILALPFLRAGRWNLFLGIGFLLLAASYQSAWFDQPGWQWIGLVTYKPPTEDYVPLLPWFGVVLLGVYAGPLMQRLAERLQSSLRDKKLIGYLAAAGRYSLWIYLLHQPLMIGALSIYIRLT